MDSLQASLFDKVGRLVHKEERMEEDSMKGKLERMEEDRMKGHMD